MNIITVFNYDDEEKYNIMFKIWTLQALKCKFETPGINKIKILTEGLSSSVLKFIHNINCNDIVIELKERKKLYNVPHRWLHNVGFKLYNLCLETEPFIFVDADAIIMNNMKDIISASKDKPFISVNHQTIPKHTDKFNFKFMNTGFFVVSDTTFLDFDKIYSAKSIFKCPGTDQYLLNNYCELINYDYTHDNIHFGWNSCAGYKLEIGNKIYSYGIPEEHEIFILHYWDIFKPWITPCKIYNKLEQKYKIFSLVIDKIINATNSNILNFDKVFKLFLRFYENPRQTIYTLDKDIYETLKLLNLKGTTYLHDKKDNNIEYITIL